VAHISLEPHDEVVVVRIHRPPANAMDLELLAEGEAVAERVRSEEHAAVVLTGSDGFFSGGVDLKFVPTLDAEGQQAMVNGINQLFAAWHGFPRPVVSAVNGHAVAGGLILALCGDWRVGATEGSYGLTELRAGVPYPAVAQAVVRNELGPSAARRLMMLADLVDAAEAQRLGVFDEVVPRSAVLERALSTAKDLASLPAAGFASLKGELRASVADVAQKVAEGGVDPVTQGWVGADTAGRAASLLGDDRG
jgi:enoyl-CoA hydratase